MNKIIATCVKNPFQPRVEENRETREFDFQKQRVRDIFCAFYPVPSSDVRIVASVNGKVYEDADWDMELAPGDNIVFVPVPQGSGGGGSNPLAMIAMIAVAVVAAVVTAGVGSVMMGGTFFGSGMVTTGLTTSALVGGALAGAAVMVGGGLLVSAIFPTPEIGMERGNLSETSPTYGWDTFNNATQEGTMLPIIIGERRVTPPIIAAHTETINGNSYLYVLMAVSEGPIDSIYGVEINGQPVSYYSGVDVETRLGYDSQSVIPFFGDVFSDFAINATLKRDAYTIRETSGDGIDGAQVHICLPMGLWYANDKGGMDEQTMGLSIQYRRVGDAEWLTYYPSSDNGAKEEYTAGKVYNPGQIVIHNNVFYKCTKYYATKTHTRRVGDSDPVTEQYTRYFESINNKRWGHSSNYDVHDTPEPPNTNCWAVYMPPQTSLTIKSNSNSAINKTYRINFPVRGQYQIQVKVTSGPPENNPRYGSKAIWAGISEIIKDDISYPGVALLGLKMKATDQLSGGIPRITCIAKKVSHTFHTAGTVDIRNPAWASYYVLNNDVWGGCVPESKIVLSDFQSWASYCSSKGITCCLYVDQRMTFNNIKNYLCEIGRANIVQMGLKFGAIIDKPGVPSQLFTVGNILKDTFKMSYLPIDDRANCIRVNYYDKDMNWEKSTVEVRTNEFITGEKERSQEITLYACDRKDLAARHAKLLLNYNKNLIRTCTFDVSVDALACTVGDIILVQHDSVRYGFGGRVAEDVLAGSPKVLKLDRKVTLIAGVAYKVVVRNDEDDQMATYEFTVPANGDYTEITTSISMSPLPKANWVYSLGEKEAKPFRIVSITRSEEFTRKITALEYVEEVYDDTHIVDVDYDYQNRVAVGGFEVAEIIDNVYSKFGSVRATWNCPGSRGVVIYYSYMNGDDEVTRSRGVFYDTSAEIHNLPLGIPITFKAVPKGSSSGYATATVTLVGESDAVYENGCYEFGVFANDELQTRFGHKEPHTLWMQEPQSVTMVFIN